MKLALKGINKLMTATLNTVLIIAVGLLVLDVVWGVFTRYTLGEQAAWTEELAKFLLIWVTLLGGAAAFATKGHLGVDYFVEKLHPEARRIVAVFSHLVVLFFALAIFVYGGWYTVSDALAIEQTTPVLQWKMGYVYLVIPIAGFFMVLFTLENMLETIDPSETGSGQAGAGAVELSGESK